MDYVVRAKQLRPLIEKAALSLTDDDAFYGPELFPSWSGNKTPYKKDARVQFNELLYKCLQDHDSQEDWTPDKAVSLWAEVPDPAIEWPEWKQPTGAHDAYQKGDKVSHIDKHWTSDIDANVYEPGEYGWTES